MTEILFRNNIDNLLTGEFDEKWKERMLEFGYKIQNYVYTLTYLDCKNLNHMFLYIYKTLQTHTDNPYVKDTIKFIIRFLNFEMKNNESKMFFLDIEKTYPKFLQLFKNINHDKKNIVYSKNFFSKSHFLFGYIVGSAIDINPVLACLLFPYGGITGVEQSTFIVRSLSWFRFIETHSILHDAFGALKLNFDIGPGYMYMYTGPKDHYSRRNPFFGNLQALTWSKRLSLS